MIIKKKKKKLNPLSVSVAFYNFRATKQVKKLFNIQYGQLKSIKIHSLLQNVKLICQWIVC